MAIESLWYSPFYQTQLIMGSFSHCFFFFTFFFKNINHSGHELDMESFVLEHIFTCAYITSKVIAHPVDERTDNVNPQQCNLESD